MQNYIYPCKEEYESYLEYQVHCPTCGEIIHFFLPEKELTRMHSMDFDTCHPFTKSIDRGNIQFYPHKMIRLREDFMGGGHVYDFYNLYPIIEGESIENRKARLLQIQLEDLKDKMICDPSKKEWIIQTLVDKNETILNALQYILEIYENTPRENWNELDQILENVDEKYDANRLLSNFNVKTTYSSAVHNTSPIGDFNNLLFKNPLRQSGIELSADQWKCPSCGSMASGVFCMTCGMPKPKEWTCTCGTINKGKFCTNCGLKKPE